MKKPLHFGSGSSKREFEERREIRGASMERKGSGSAIPLPFMPID